MNTTRTFSQPFHKFLIYGALWAWGIGMILIGIQNSAITLEDRVPPQGLILAMQAVLAVAGLLVIKARFELARMQKSGALKLLIAFLAAAVVFFIDWRIYDETGELMEKSGIYALVSACWGISIYRYYRAFDGMMKD